MRTAAILTGVAAVATLAAAMANPTAERPAGRDGITVVPAPATASPRRPTQVAGQAGASAPRPPARALALRGTWWHPRVADTWQWQLTGTIDTAYDAAVYDIDLVETPDAVLARLRGQGRRIVCYFSAGSAERYRADYDQFQPADLGRPLDGWPDERWVDTRSANVRRIMAARLDAAAARGCDGVEPDNVDGYANRNGLALSAADQLDFNRFIADAAHARGLAVGLKNDLAQVKALEPAFDFAVNEQCSQYRECARLRPFTAAGKPVWNAEYAARFRTNTNGARDALCAASRMASLRTLVLPLKLNDAFRYSCD